MVKYNNKIVTIFDNIFNIKIMPITDSSSHFIESILIINLICNLLLKYVENLFIVIS